MRYFRIAVFTCFFFASAVAQAQHLGDITGKWLSADKDARIEIYHAGKTFSGKIVWMKDPDDKNGHPKKDGNNPDPKLRNRPILHLVILSGFVYTDGVWENGKIYDPTSGKTYSATIKRKGEKLEIRGFVGVSLLGRTTVWTKG